ncbi:MAG: SagB/ThcOx family dehydrogenase [Candidatus Aenigmarchaeota archaeon]|nr:SagB/ThcOx family dehydrogenase [Candidatus Aenigmarchaeota archaeon]
MIGKITFILLILTIATGFIKKRKLHEQLALLTLFSLFLHVLESPSFSLQCYLILAFSILTFLTGLKVSKIKSRVKLHVLFSVILLILVVFHVFSLAFLPKLPATIGTRIITADFSRTTSKYGERGERYVYLEAGHSAQNVYLQVTALNLGSVVVGAFNDQEVQNVLSIPEDHKPIYLIPVGYPV